MQLKSWRRKRVLGAVPVPGKRHGETAERQVAVLSPTLFEARAQGTFPKPTTKAGSGQRTAAAHAPRPSKLQRESITYRLLGHGLAQWGRRSGRSVHLRSVCLDNLSGRLSRVGRQRGARRCSRAGTRRAMRSAMVALVAGGGARRRRSRGGDRRSVAGGIWVDPRERGAQGLRGAIALSACRLRVYSAQDGESVETYRRS